MKIWLNNFTTRKFHNNIEFVILHVQVYKGYYHCMRQFCVQLFMTKLRCGLKVDQSSNQLQHVAWRCSYVRNCTYEHHCCIILSYTTLSYFTHQLLKWMLKILSMLMLVRTERWFLLERIHTDSTPYYQNKSLSFFLLTRCWWLCSRRCSWNPCNTTTNMNGIYMYAHS